MKISNLVRKNGFSGLINSGMKIYIHSCWNRHKTLTMVSLLQLSVLQFLSAKNEHLSRTTTNCHRSRRSRLTGCCDFLSSTRSFDNRTQKTLLPTAPVWLHADLLLRKTFLTPLPQTATYKILHPLSLHHAAAWQREPPLVSLFRLAPSCHSISYGNTK